MNVVVLCRHAEIYCIVNMESEVPLSSEGYFEKTCHPGIGDIIRFDNPEIHYGMQLSDVLQDKFQDIVDKVEWKVH